MRMRAHHSTEIEISRTLCESALSGSGCLLSQTVRGGERLKPGCRPLLLVDNDLLYEQRNFVSLLLLANDLLHEHLNFILLVLSMPLHDKSTRLCLRTRLRT